MLTSKNHHCPVWCPWFVWLLWNPVDAVGCRNEQTGVTDHAKVATTGLLVVALVLHAVRVPLQWWELLILGTLAFSSLALYTTLLKSGIFSMTEDKSTVEQNTTNHTTIDETLTIRQERDPARGVDPTP